MLSLQWILLSQSSPREHFFRIKQVLLILQPGTRGIRGLQTTPALFPRICK